VVCCVFYYAARNRLWAYTAQKYKSFFSLYKLLNFGFYLYTKNGREKIIEMNSTIPFDRLKGRENFAVWKTQAKSYLTVKGLWKYVSVGLAENANEEQIDKEAQAMAQLTLLLDPCTFSHIATATTAKSAWESLIEAFENKSVTRKVDLLRQLVQLRLTDCNSVEEYVNKMILTSLQVNTAGLTLDDEVIASLMLAGLPEEFLPMVLAVENSKEKLTVDAVKSILLQDAKFDSKSGGALLAKSKKKPNKKFKCHACGEIGHFAKSCANKNKKKNSNQSTHENNNENLLLVALIANESSRDNWYVDSGATAHMTSNRYFLHNQKTTHTDRNVIVVNKEKMKIECSGDVKMKFMTEKGD